MSRVDELKNRNGIDSGSLKPTKQSSEKANAISTAIFLAIAVLMLAGLLFGATLFTYAVLAISAVFLICRYLANDWSVAIALRRQLISHEIEIGQEVQIGVIIENTQRSFIPWLLVEDVLSRRVTHSTSKALEIVGSPVKLCILGSRQQRLLNYSLKALRRGYFQIGPTIVETGDLLGLYRKFRVASVPEFLTVLPKIIPLAGYEISSRRPIGEIQVAYRSMEDPTLISGIRQYQQGDALSRIHWRATARVGKLQSKVFQPTTVAGAMLVLDMHRKSNPDHHEPVRTDLAITAVASIAHTLYQMQQQFGFVSNGRDAFDRIRTEGWATDYRSREVALASLRSEQENLRLRPMVHPAGRGPEHFKNLHRILARLERTDGLELANLLLESQSRLPRDASVIAIVQQVDEVAALALGMLARQGYAVSAIVNHFESESVREASKLLVAQRIPVYHLKDEDSIPYICQRMLLKY
ncbi:MAG: DUF58 domain-containing protein [Pirellulaceae bacterium]|nr:DUF58 domain-containing protein [Pirellulaceae bacterium]